MKLLHFILLASLAFTVACSKKVKPDSEEAVPQDENTKVSEIVDPDLVVEADEQKALMADEPEKAPENAVVQAEETKPEAMIKEEPQIEIKDEPIEKVVLAGEVGEYKVEKGETLMMIAFKIYGDYSKWREIAKMNPQAKNAVTRGMTLKFKAPAEKFVWNPAGEPYLIKKGDTLGSVSKERYGTPRKWKKVWDNNKPLIKNPNLIFAGFTLYTLPDNHLADIE